MITSLEIGKNEHFIKKGDSCACVYWLLKGRAVLLTDRAEIVLSGGSVIGVPDLLSGTFGSDYVTVEDCKFYRLDIRGADDLKQIYTSQQGYDAVLLLAVVNTASQILREYHAAYEEAGAFLSTVRKCKEIMETIGAEYGVPKDYNERISVAASEEPGEDPSWLLAYYREFSARPLAKMQEFYGGKHSLVTGEILSASNYLSSVLLSLDRLKAYLETHKDLLLAGDQKDLSQVLLSLARRVPAEKRQEILRTLGEILTFAEMSAFYTPEQKALLKGALDEYTRPEEAAEGEAVEEEITDPLDAVLAYAECDMQREEEIRELVTAYRALSDPADTDDETRQLRRRLTNAFYELYKRVLKRSFTETELPVNIAMFLNFGLLDETLAGEEQTRALRDLAAKLPLCEDENVFTMPHWLRSIYDGRNEPSKNEFDMDYEAYLREEKKAGRLTDDEEKAKKYDSWAKVEFEIDNMMKSNSRATYGRVLTFCPALLSSDLAADPSGAFLTAEKIKGAFAQIEATDYSIFYHDSLFSDPEHGINSETVKQKIYPNVILMPNVGVKAMMWQEAAGIRSNTPARFTFPIFLTAELFDQMLATAARYRWEFCRKVEGVRWNDVTEKSLTAQYCDYLQFYKKNRELTPELREKLSQELSRVKNNFREVFVKDYANWMKYESKGSFRLNKVAREIVIEYCPLSAKDRAALLQNPTFGKRIERMENLRERDKKRLKTVIDRYKEAGGENVGPLEATLLFYEM